LAGGRRQGAKDRSALARCLTPPVRAAATLVAVSLALGAVAPAPARAASNKVRISKLTDVAFGSIANLSQDAVRSQSVCLYADTATNGYDITASGTGPGGAFELTSGAAAMGYQVQWSSSAGQTSGAQLAPNVPLTGQVASATHQTCGTGPATSASLIVVLPATALSSAMAGAYNGTLTLVVGPE
jgi:hypothetical protein